MIKLQIEVQDWDNGGIEKVISIPSDIKSELNRQNDYVIVDSTPDIPGISVMDIWELNEIIDGINSENPAMTTEFFALIMDAVDGNLEDDEFIRRIKENDFVFEDLSDITWKMSSEEIAACYIATELKVPFDTGITKEILEFIGKDEITDYIDWFAIWSQYELIGFKIAEDDDGNIYLIHWR